MLVSSESPEYEGIGPIVHRGPATAQIQFGTGGFFRCMEFRLIVEGEPAAAQGSFELHTTRRLEIVHDKGFAQPRPDMTTGVGMVT
jgi:hypothetical protein